MAKSLHVAFFNRSFYPESAATGQLLTELCEDLVQKHGCRVSVVAGIPLSSVEKPGERRRTGWIIERESFRGIEILRARGTRFPKRRFVGRFINYVTYFASACWAGLRLQRPHVVVALTDPPIIGLAAYLAGLRFRAPLVISFRDIFPEVARLLEDFRSRRVEQILEGVNRFLIRRASKIVALGQTMCQKLIEEKGADPRKTLVIPDWADCSQIIPQPKRNPFSLAHGLADRFVVMHAGNLGLSQSLETLVEAAAHLKEWSEIAVVFVGEGVRKPALEAQVRDLRLSNVRFLPYQPQEALSDAFGSADLFVISLKEGLAGYIVPSKLYGILAAGRPYVACVEESCEVSLIAQQCECGLTARPGDAQDLAEKILALYRDRTLAQRLGTNARKAALHFDRPLGVQKYFDLFLQLSHGK